MSLTPLSYIVCMSLMLLWSSMLINSLEPGNWGGYEKRITGQNKKGGTKTDIARNTYCDTHKKKKKCHDILRFLSCRFLYTTSRTIDSCDPIRPGYAPLFYKCESISLFIFAFYLCSCFVLHLLISSMYFPTTLQYKLLLMDIECTVHCLYITKVIHRHVYSWWSSSARTGKICPYISYSCRCACAHATKRKQDTSIISLATAMC